MDCRNLFKADCIRCKGNVNSPFSCGRSFCPIYEQASSMFKSVDLLNSNELYGSSPSVFVGYSGYPRVNVGILSPSLRNPDAWVHDAPMFWANNEYSVKDVVGLRSSLINSRFLSNVKFQSSKFIEIAQEISMASKPVDIDVMLEKKPSVNLSFSDVHMPMGPKAKLRQVVLASNPSIPSKVEKAVYDTDLKSMDALKALYEKNISNYELSKILSLGNLGLKKDRKLVPTRWSITAVHDALGKFLTAWIKSCNHADYQYFFGGYLGNYFIVMLFPDVWGFELFETYAPGSLWNKTGEISVTTDYEFYEGRKSYAENCGGGYYACRFAVLEKLKEMKKQASVVVLRFITDEYSAPLGVWVVQEAVRKALSLDPMVCSSEAELINSVKELVWRRFNARAEEIFRKSRLLEHMHNQTKLTNFFS